MIDGSFGNRLEKKRAHKHVKTKVHGASWMIAAAIASARQQRFESNTNRHPHDSPAWYKVLATVPFKRIITGTTGKSANTGSAAIRHAILAGKARPSPVKDKH